LTLAIFSSQHVFTTSLHNMSSEHSFTSQQVFTTSLHNITSQHHFSTSRHNMSSQHHFTTCLFSISSDNLFTIRNSTSQNLFNTLHEIFQPWPLKGEYHFQLADVVRQFNFLVFMSQHLCLEHCPNWLLS